MEGILYLYEGMFTGFRKYYGKLTENGQFYLSKNKEAKRHILRIPLSSNDGIYPISLNQRDFMIVVKSSVKYTFRAENVFARVQWLQATNSFTLNLGDDF
jgi:hypothetical protein